MNKQMSVLNQVLSVFASFFLLNLLWILSCLPIVTLFPATAAMFGTVRKWTLEGLDVGVFKVYGREFKANFKKSFAIGLIWWGTVIILYMNYAIVLQYEFFGRNLLLIVLFFFTLLVTFTVLYLFFILTNYELTILHTLRNSLLLAISHLNYTVLLLGMIVVALVTVYYFPILLFVIFSLLAFCLYGIVNKITAGLERLKNGKSSMGFRHQIGGI